MSTNSPQAIRVLLVEDEDFDVARVKKTVSLSTTRIQVESVVSNGKSALDKIRESPDFYDVVILDYQISGGLRGEELIGKMKELDPFLQTPVRQLSLGQRIRGELTAAMLHDPELLFLDEPTIGLDVVAKQRVRDFLVEINREDGVTVMLTTHDLGDIERLCSRLLVIDHGSLIWDGGIPELKERYGAERTLVVDLEEPAPPLSVEGARVERVDGPRQWLRFRGSASDLTARVVASARVLDLQIAEPDIEEIVRRIYMR